MSTLSSFKNVCLGVIHGFWDSIRGMTLVLYIDEEINKLNAEKEAERHRKILERKGRFVRRTPSPTPSSASAMEREEKEYLSANLKRDNPDERSLSSMLKKDKAPVSPKLQGERKIAKKVLKCCILNGGFTWMSIILFERLLLPCLKSMLTFCYGDNSRDIYLVWDWLQSILSIIFDMMWVLPIFFLSKIVSSLWFADIANAAYQVRKGQPQLIPNISKLVADFLFNLLVQALFLVQSMLVNKVPIRYVGGALYFVHFCMLYSLYSFEYKWFNMGWELHRRLSYIENNWPYFLGFGIPLTILTNMTSSLIVSSCIFSIFFPLFILSGNEARPIIGTTSTPLRLFSPVIFFSNLFFSRAENRTKNILQYSTQHIEQQKQQILFKQQLEEHNIQQKHKLPKENRDHRSDSPMHRYQQPPSLSLHRPMTNPMPSLPSRTNNTERGRYSGLYPLTPTPMAGSPSSAGTSVRRR